MCSKRKKFCLIPCCESSSTDTPNKIFFQVPFVSPKRDLWLAAMQIYTKFANSTRLWVCQDHFNLETDMEDYLRYRLMGSLKIYKIKNGILPHIFPKNYLYLDNEQITRCETIVDDIGEETQNFSLEIGNTQVDIQDPLILPETSARQSQKTIQMKKNTGIKRLNVNVHDPLVLPETSLKQSRLPIEMVKIENVDLNLVKQEVDVDEPIPFIENFLSVKIKEEIFTEDQPMMDDNVRNEEIKNSNDVFKTPSVSDEAKEYFCRICLATSKNLIDVFQLDGDKISFYSKFRRVFPDLELENIINFCKICNDCCSKLRQVYGFRNACKQANERIRNVAKTKLHKNAFEESLRIKIDNKMRETNDISTYKISHINRNKTKNDTKTISLKCNYCNYDFKDSKALKTHIKNHLKTSIKSVIKIYACNNCRLKFLNVSSLTKHNRDVHKSHEQPLKTILKRTERLKILTNTKLRKLSSHRGRGNDVFLCENCGKTFKADESFKRNLLWHSCFKWYFCGSCHGKFKTYKRLKEHKYVHSKTNVFICKICGSNNPHNPRFDL